MATGVERFETSVGEVVWDHGFTAPETAAEPPKDWEENWINLKIMGTIDSRRQDRPGILRMLRNTEVQRMWDVVATHEFPMTEIEEALKISATQQCGKILLYPHRVRGQVDPPHEAQ